ncbi:MULTISPECIES: acetyl/propionyl/methylcrotonyl-CoA carboxylase subunit alpha [Micrococcus]|uniref:acetyl/propionyl/methylcrotonyl-CoA carboxylase subunit alpha n=1 Tax=Micrococcus TaxID=1269 RepID=UPI001E2FA846|nr:MULTISPECIES: biotin carboxylase N-terminal domain-containing protein [Micrococcus]MCD0180687.1 ATP-grasp domain-containing protein [Micrococcus luteus]MCT2255050.1 ATP-grasp domain-containing protein [Micrococcus luteus]MCV7534116.1 ATP-grasp domain-containing protein [Micrococcus luteus]MCV7551925.1 ATP-grasp domain-containing protein [Micrococcus luteus]MCV7590890.1 ATP-grasp domain-containing protein [Micrococcus luteus]
MTTTPAARPVTRVLIANRGEIAVRVARAARDHGIASIAVYSDPDADALHVAVADEAFHLPGASSADTYLKIDAVLDVARRAGADAVHPGYGFLSENADFAQAVIDAGMTWIGPSPDAIRALGDKITARSLAQQAGAPLVPGSDGPVPDAAAARTFAEEHGLPIAIKAAFGGGGRGIRVVRELGDVEDAFEATVREAVAAFGRGECFVERFLDRPRHVEAQVLADEHGHVAVLGTRDCSLQRRNQKLVEEAPAPFLTDEQRERIHTSAREICRAAGYTGAGTVEYLVAPDGLISFLEVNTRLQVEHPVTEEVFGVDLVREQFRVAAGEPLSIPEDPTPRGHALEFRLNAEDPAYGFLPVPGPIDAFEAPTGPGVRMDSGVRTGSVVPGEYDSLLAKLIVWGEDRAQAIARARDALAELRVDGVPTVVPFHRAVLEQDAFTSGDRLGVYTTWIESEFAEPLAESPYLGAEVPAGGRTAVTVELDGRAVRLGLPADLYAALLGGGGAGAAAPAGAAGVAKTDDDGAVASPVTGTLASWKVEDGAEVAEGDTVAIVEAMKMETPIRAPRAGRIQLLVAETPASVTRGQAIARLGA